MQALVLYHSKVAAIGQLVLAAVGVLVGVGILANVADAGVVPVLFLIASAVLGVTGGAKLVSAVPALIVDPQGVRSRGAVIPWDAITAVEVAQGGIPIRLTVRLRVRGGAAETIDLQELNMRPNEALRELLLRVEQRRPDLLSAARVSTPRDASGLKR
jgi:hypothetical protein